MGINPLRGVISIHAPPRGATRPFQDFFDLFFDFNSRPSARGDLNPPPLRAAAPLFQFTPLREGRLLACWRSDAQEYFNSRPSARGDNQHQHQHRPQAISIHAPPRGATGIFGSRGQCPRISIHAPPRGATAKDMQFLQIFCSTLTNQHGLTIVPRNLSRLFW